MRKPKTITIREHVTEIERLEREYAKRNLRRTALDYAISSKNEFSTAETLIKSAKLFETYLKGGS